MALSMKLKSNIGIEIDNAYIRIDEIHSDKFNRVQARMSGYVNKEAFINGNKAISGSEDFIYIDGNFEDDSVNIKKQIYEYAKTLDKYSGAIDVLD